MGYQAGTFSHLSFFQCVLNGHAFTIITYTKRIRNINTNEKELLYLWLKPSLEYMWKTCEICSGRCTDRSGSNIGMNTRKWECKGVYERCMSNRPPEKQTQRIQRETTGKEKEESK